MTPEERLRVVEDLFRKRAAIDRELLDVMAGVDCSPVEQPEVPTKRKFTLQEYVGRRGKAESQPAKQTKGCPECGSISKHKSSCSRPAQTAKRALGNPCNECKKVSKHAKWCSRFVLVENAAKLKSDIDGHYQKKAGRTILDEPLRLNEEQYDDVMASIGDGLSLDNVGYSYPDIELHEIRKASNSENYNDYLAS